MVIEEHEYGIFFTDEFGDQAFQRWSDINKVRMEALVSYLVVASMVKSPENERFSMKLRKLIAKHPDQEKLKSKKVKLYKMVFVPFTAIDNHRRCVTICSVLLKNEIAESYGWLLRAFMKAFVHASKIAVTNQDGAMRKTIDAEFPYSKDMICM
nr:hypothetical protein [Tanacetum cinerariifolium]